MTDRQHYEQEELWGTGNVALPDHQLLRLDAIEQLLPPDSTRVLDVGAGDGRVLHHLLGRRPALVAVAAERSVTALRHVRGAYPVQASIDALPFADRSADTVLCCEVLEHLPEPAFRSGLAELGRVAGHHVVLTVPNREVRRRADITCSACGCRYNRERHLRSFRAEDLPGLLPGFSLAEVIQTGPRQPIYPRRLRTLLERRGVVPVLGSPSCPQCDERYLADRRQLGSPAEGNQGSRYRTLRALVPKQRHPYWLCARFTRVRVS